MKTGVAVRGATTAQAQHSRVGRWLLGTSRLLALTVVVCGAITLIAPAGPGAVLVSARAGDVSAFSGGIQQVNGTLTAVGPVHGADAQTFAAAYAGTGGGQASGTFNVSWRQGQSVEYDGAFYYPRISISRPPVSRRCSDGTAPRTPTGASSRAVW